MNKFQSLGIANLFMGFINVVSPLLIYFYVVWVYGAEIFTKLMSQSPRFTLLKIMVFAVFVGVFNLMFAGLFYFAPRSNLQKYYTAAMIYTGAALFFSLLLGAYLFHILSEVS